MAVISGILRGYGKITKLICVSKTIKYLRSSAFICGLFFKICHFIFRQTLTKTEVHELILRIEQKDNTRIKDIHKILQ